MVGADADITVFDPAKIKDMATFDKPMQASVGIRYVLVGGQVMATDGRVTRPGGFRGRRSVADNEAPRPARLVIPLIAGLQQSDISRTCCIASVAR